MGGRGTMPDLGVVPTGGAPRLGTLGEVNADLWEESNLDGRTVGSGARRRSRGVDTGRDA